MDEGQIEEEIKKKETVEKLNDYLYFLENKEMVFIVIRQINADKNYDIFTQIENRSLKEKKKKIVLVYDFWNINESLEPKKQMEIEAFYLKNKPSYIVFKHCLVKESFSFFGNNKLKLEGLYITDELYSMSPNLNNLFENVKTKKLYVKKIKINSKKQLSNFFDFIKNTECEELILDDVFIELIIKEKKDDDNELNQYFSYEDGKIIVKKDEEIYCDNIKKLKLIDCPLFALPEGDNSFKDINNYKDISIDIDENSLLNPEMITKFKINEGLIDVCYDLDSFKVNNEDEKKDYLEYIKYIIGIILENINNYRKIKFKNFDITKFEYVTGENYINFDENSNIWVLNEEENNKKKQFENFDTKIKDEIKGKKFENMKELIIDNCTNNFIELILSMINTDLDLLKLKKCAKDFFYIEKIRNIYIKHLFLFDTPIKYEEFKNGEPDKLSLKIVTLGHYCQENNLNYYKTMDQIRTLISSLKKSCICFEMNALPILMTFLMSEIFYNNQETEKEKKILTYFPKDLNTEKKEENNKDDKNEKNKQEEKKELFRKYWANKSEEFKSLKDKKIILKKNNIRNQLENFYILKDTLGIDEFKKEDKNKNAKSDFGRDIACLDIDYQSFFIKNQLKEIILENCLFTNFKNVELKSQEIIKKLNQIKINPTFENFFNENITYKIDMKTLKELIFNQNDINDFAMVMKIYNVLEEEKGKLEDLSKKAMKKEEKGKLEDLFKKVIQYFNLYADFYTNLKNLFSLINGKIIIVINNIIELKELYCLIHLSLEHFESKKYLDGKIQIPQNWKNKNIENYFVKEYNEDNKFVYTIFNYYYECDEEKKYYEGLKNYKADKNFKENKIKTIKDIKFEIEYKYDDPWKIIFE